LVTAVVQGLQASLGKVTMGDPRVEGVRMGPLASLEQKREVLARVAELLRQHNARTVNIDATIIAEAPKISPHVAAMRKEIAAALKMSESEISVKATTNEGLGTIGRGEGIAAIAVASVEQS